MALSYVKFVKSFNDSVNNPEAFGYVFGYYIGLSRAYEEPRLPLQALYKILLDLVLIMVVYI